jgi:hypothetical protein
MITYRLLTLLTTLLCALILGISIAGIVTSRLALNIRDNYGSDNGVRSIYQEGSRQGSGRLSPDLTTGWYYLPLPRNIRYGNEEAALGCSAAVLVLIVFPLLTSAVAKVRPVSPNHLHPLSDDDTRILTTAHA